MTTPWHRWWFFHLKQEEILKKAKEKKLIPKSRKIKELSGSEKRRMWIEFGGGDKSII